MDHLYPSIVIASIHSHIITKSHLPLILMLLFTILTIQTCFSIYQFDLIFCNLINLFLLIIAKFINRSFM